jgi:hypothetical protein
MLLRRVAIFDEILKPFQVGRSDRGEGDDATAFGAKPSPPVCV